MAEILAIRRKTLSNQSINQSTKFPIVDPGRFLSVIVKQSSTEWNILKRKWKIKLLPNKPIRRPEK